MTSLDRLIFTLLAINTISLTRDYSSRNTWNTVGILVPALRGHVCNGPQKAFHTRTSRTLKLSYAKFGLSGEPKIKEVHPTLPPGWVGGTKIWHSCA